MYKKWIKVDLTIDVIVNLSFYISLLVEKVFWSIIFEIFCHGKYTYGRKSLKIIDQKNDKNYTLNLACLLADICVFISLMIGIVNCLNRISPSVSALSMLSFTSIYSLWKVIKS